MLTALGLLLLIVAPGAAAAGPSWVFAPQSASATVPSGRVFAAGAGAPDGVSGVFYGGQEPGPNNSGALADTWVNSKTGFTPKCGTTEPGATDPCGPGPRSSHGMASGPNGVLLYGGFGTQLGNGAPTGDMWQWDGATWTRLCDTCDPGARAVFAMAGNGEQAVLYGGLGPNGFLDDTWVYDGTSWTQTCGGTLATSCGPGGLAGASIAWDGNQFVLFGGTEATNNSDPPSAATWTFDGTKWTKLCGAPAKTCGPPGRVFGAFTYAHDNPGGISGAILAQGGDLFGATTSTLYRDAWLWHDGAWTELAPPWAGAPVTFPGNSDGPPPGSDPLIGVLVTEPVRCQVVYLGTLPTGTGTTAQTYRSVTFVGGRNRAGNGEPSGCRAPSAPAASEPTSSSRAPAPGPQGAVLAATGPRHIQQLTVVALGLMAAGAGTLVLAAKQRSRGTRR